MKKRNKINGFAGVINFLLATFGLGLQAYVVYTLSKLICKLLDISIHNALVVMLIVTIIINVIITGYYLINKKYFIRLITEEEYSLLKQKKLIHYTNYIKCYDSTTNIVQLQGNDSARANYSMRWKDAKKKFIWFHISDKHINTEPDIKSFYSAHLFEKTRKYKVIIDPSKLDRNRLYIRDLDGCIVYGGEIRTEAILEKDFKWYTDKVTIVSLIDSLNPINYGLLFILLFMQLTGDIRDLLSE